MPQEEGFINRKRVVAAIVLLLLVLLLVFLLWWWFARPAVNSTTVTNTTPAVNEKVILPPQKTTVNAPVTTNTATPNEGELYIMNLARNFTERYGSFSTDSRYQNLIDLYGVVTPSLRAEFEATVAETSSQSSFRGMQTRALTITITNLTATRAEVDVAAQRVATDNSLVETVSYETLEISMRKNGEFWLVDTAVWRNNE